MYVKEVSEGTKKHYMDNCGLYVVITEHVNWPTVPSYKPLLYSSHISVLPHPQSSSIRLGTEAGFSPSGQAGARENAVGKPLTPPHPGKQTTNKPAGAPGTNTTTGPSPSVCLSHLAVSPCVIVWGEKKTQQKSCMSAQGGSKSRGCCMLCRL